MTNIHPLKQLAALHGQEIHSIAPPELIENSDGEPIGVTSPLRITGGMIGLIVTQREADEAGLDYDTPGLTIINEYGDIIVQNSEEEYQ